uniref:Phospholipase-like protein n=1 Tax=Tanacetum cinerariifolium TaxID=118510 RepID=A0A699H384_TANCI|nr:hypothetical protein [Tanacetum cinerariifolium]
MSWEWVLYYNDRLSQFDASVYTKPTFNGPYDCKVTIWSRPSMISIIKEGLSKSNKRLKLFKDNVFGKYLDLDVEENANHLLKYVLLHQRPQLNMCFRIRQKNSENKASLGKVAQGKAAKGKAAKGEAMKGKDAKCKAAQEQIFMGQKDKKIVINSFLRLVEDLAAWDDFSWGEYYWEEFYKKAVNLIDNHEDTHTNFKKKRSFKITNVLHIWNCLGIQGKYLLNDQNEFTRDDEPEAEQDRSGALDITSARAKVVGSKTMMDLA